MKLHFIHDYTGWENKERIRIFEKDCDKPRDILQMQEKYCKKCNKLKTRRVLL